jgi:two-component system LytT family response regulator
VHALDYLLKPFKQERFQTALEHVRAQITKNDSHETNPGLTALIEKVRVEQNYVDRFMIKTSNRIVFVKAGDVDWIESAANYVLLHVGEKTHIVRETMRSLEARLCPKTFQRISRSAIVNVERIKELQPMGKGDYVVFLTTGKQLTMSRGIRELNQALGSS